MEYISSKFTYSQVLEILNSEESKSTKNTKNPRYIVLLLSKKVSSVLVFLLAVFIYWQLFYNNTTYLFPWEKVMDSCSNSIFVTSLLYLYFVIIYSLLLHRLLMFLCRQIENYYIKKRYIIPNKYETNSSEIKKVYENIDLFTRYITENPELTEQDFHISMDGEKLIRDIQYMDGDVREIFYFGPALKEIIIEHRILDFSKLDKYYKLV